MAFAIINVSYNLGTLCKLLLNLFFPKYIMKLADLDKIFRRVLNIYICIHVIVYVIELVSEN